MTHFIFGNVHEADENRLMQGSYLIVLQAVRVPPHLLVAVNGKTWSISVSGQLPGEPLEKLFAYIQRKHVPTIFSELRLPEGVSAAHFAIMLDEAVSKYPEVHANAVTCLHPIREVAAQVFGEEAEKARFIFELIPALEKSHAIGTHFGFYVREYLDANGHLAMPVYSAEDVAAATEEAARQFAENKE